MSEPARADIGREILALVEEDQRLRRELVERDRADTERLREIVTEIGWPSRSKVGERAEHMAWLLLQHADADRAFQQHCLDLMKQEPPTEVCPGHIAYLEDRLAIAFGKPQRFGTQLYPGRDGLEPLPVEDPEHLDERRASAGLEPIAEYLAMVRRGAAAASSTDR